VSSKTFSLVSTVSFNAARVLSYVCRPVLFYGRPRTRSAISNERKPFDGGNEPINPLRTNVANSLETGRTDLGFDDHIKNMLLSTISRRIIHWRISSPHLAHLCPSTL